MLAMLVLHDGMLMMRRGRFFMRERRGMIKGYGAWTRLRRVKESDGENNTVRWIEWVESQRRCGLKETTSEKLTRSWQLARHEYLSTTTKTNYGMTRRRMRNGLVSGVTSTTTCFQGVELSTIGAMAGRGEREKSSSTQMN